MKKEAPQTDCQHHEFREGEVWNRFFNPVIMKVFHTYNPETDILFAITGDLDNLGVYVARNGRAAAEMLVDMYNQVIRNVLAEWTAKHKSSMKTLSFVPSGEEVLVLGLTYDANVLNGLFGKIRELVMASMLSLQNKGILYIGETAASFGCRIFGDELNKDLCILQKLMSIETNGDLDDIIVPQYIEVVSKIRTFTAIALDEQKFKDILDGEHPIKLRQLVLTRMLLYKKTTKEILKSFNSLPRENVEEILSLLSNDYGVEVGLEDQIDTLIKALLHRN